MHVPACALLPVPVLVCFARVLQQTVFFPFLSFPAPSLSLVPASTQQPKQAWQPATTAACV